MTLVDCCKYNDVSQDTAGFIVKAGEFMYPDHCGIRILLNVSI
jgi:hypothetical protein